MVANSRARDSAVSGWWTTPAREIPHFSSGGRLQRVRFPDPRAMDGYRAWDSPIPERWTITARGFLPFPSGGPLPRVGFSDSRAVDGYRTWDSAVSERWTVPTRRYPYILGDRPFQPLSYKRIKMNRKSKIF